MPKTSPREALEQVLLAVRGEPLVILISGHPDPDAIGAALAHQRICEALGVPATIAHVHPLSHRENRALVKLLHVDMVQVSTRADLARFKHLSLVDTTAPDPAIELPADLHLLSIVDHHRPIGTAEAPFVDSRPELGASCTMYCEYLSQGLAPFGGERQDAKIATALLFGIQTDTDDFQLATPDDFRAAAYAKAFCDTDLLVRVGRRTVGAAAMDVLGRALASLVVIRDFALAGVERVSANDRDSIGGAADFILRREDIDTVLVYGIVEDRIDGSLRTRSPSVDPASFLQTAFGRDRDGRPYGGGRADKGGFQIPLGVLADSDPDALWKIVQESVENRIARVVPELDHSRDTRHPEAVRTIMKSLSKGGLLAEASTRTLGTGQRPPGSSRAGGRLDEKSTPRCVVGAAVGERRAWRRLGCVKFCEPGSPGRPFGRTERDTRRQPRHHACGAWSGACR